MKMNKTLNELGIGERGSVSDLTASGSIRRRFRDLGITDGAKIICMGQSTHRDIASYLIKGAVIAIRRDDAETVLID